MSFENLRIKEIKYIVRYNSVLKQWVAKNRNDHIIGIKLNGISVHEMVRKKLTMMENDIFFLNQKDDYGVCVIEQGSSFSVHFTTYEEIDTDSFCVHIKNNREIISLLEKAERAKIKDGGELEAMKLLYNLCEIFGRIISKPYYKNDLAILEAKEYIDLNFKNNDCVDKASHMYGCTRRRFQDIFKNSFDVTPNRYVTMCKVSKAKELLEVGYLPVSSVAEMSGFSDIYYFSKVFKKETGYSPSEYKKTLIL